MAKKAPEVEFNEEEPKKRNKKIMTLFFLMVPSLLLAMTASIPSIYIRFSFQIVLILYHFVIFKNLLDTYLGED
jgi:hypothetical protein